MFLFYFNPFLIIAALLPAALLLRYIYNKDKLEHEPAGLLRSLLLYGVISTALAAFIELIGSALIELFFEENSLPYNILMYFGVVAFAEEGSKYFLLRKQSWDRQEFNCTFDGVVYAVFLSLGFAAWENISYVAAYGLPTALVRAFTAVPGHACFGVFMGAYYGAAKLAERSGNHEKSLSLRRMAVIIPAFLHGLYDFIATDSTSDFSGLVFFAFIIIMFISARKTVDALSERDSYMPGKDQYI